MYLGFHNLYAFYNGNRMFREPSGPIGDDLLYPMVYLGRYLTDLGHRVATIDTDDLAAFDAVVFLDYPPRWNRYFRRLVRAGHQRLYLLALESAIIWPANYDRARHEPFHRVFTWDPGLVDGKKYLQFTLANKLVVDETLFDPGLKSKFCTLISSHKYHPHPLELYSERVRAIRWYERNHPDLFDLYGVGWDRYYPPRAHPFVNAALSAAYRRLGFLPRLRLFPSYRGRVASKRSVLKNYKFSICYENVSLPGYITEKMIDSLMAGCVPVYLGAPEIQERIPAACFIDRRDFKSYEELHAYLAGMSPAEHAGYLEAILAFLRSDAAHPFSAECFAETLSKELLK